MRTRALVPALFAMTMAASSCTPQAPAVQPAGTTPSPTLAPGAPGPAPVMPPPPPPGTTAQTPQPRTPWMLRAMNAMQMDGTIDTETLIHEINRRAPMMDACAVLIRETDQAVGSLNVKVTVTATGTNVDLQSPVNPRAEICLRETMQSWSLQEAGTGRAMVLLAIDRGR